jgi:hypothetical protein
VRNCPGSEHFVTRSDVLEITQNHRDPGARRRGGDETETTGKAALFPRQSIAAPLRRTDKRRASRVPSARSVHRTSLLRFEMWDDLVTKQAERMEHFLVSHWSDGAKQNHFLDSQRFVQFDEPDALRRRTDTE